MPRVQGTVFARYDERWSVLAVDVQDSGTSLASSPVALPSFFAGWATVGALLALVLVARGHDPRTVIALGVGLGPLMAIVASSTIRHRERVAAAVVLEPGVRRGGGLDVLLLVQGEPADVRSVLPVLETVRPEIRSLTLARAVAYEWLEGDLENDAVRAATDALHDAATRLPVAGAAVALIPGPLEVVVESFRRHHDRALVLVAMAEPGDGPDAAV